VNKRTSANNCPIIDISLSRHSNITGENAVVAYATIMCNMYIRHDEAVVTYYGSISLAGSRAAIDGHTLPDSCIVSNDDVALFSMELEILGFCSDYGTGENFAIFTYSDIIKNSGIRSYTATIPYFNISGYVTE
jgi:hypothetical protein